MVEEFLDEVSAEEDWSLPKGSAVEKLSNMFPKQDFDEEEFTKTLEEKYESNR